MARPPTTTNYPLRFWLKTTITDSGCVLWYGTMNDTGYGVFFWEYPLHGVKQRSRNWYAHRWIWTFMNGLIPDGLVVRHKCHARTCVNPAHLELGTHEDNNRDMVMAGRHRNQKKTHCMRGHEFTPENTRTDHGNRQCRACDRIRDNKRRAKSSSCPTRSSGSTRS